MTKKINKKFKRLFRNFKSFSLVELIIVIAIIAILSVAGFMTLTKWIGKSRNSRRISDLKNIEKALTINYTEKGKYPTPSNNGGVNYSGSILWKQGTFGQETIDKMDEFTTVPKDPLTKTGYDYSVTENQKKYEISAAMESVGIAYTDIRKYVDKVYAGDYYSKVLGNYDSLSLGVKTGNNCYTLSIPSIIISDFTGRNMEMKIDGSKQYGFVMEGGKNIGPSYKSALKETRKGTKFGVKSVYSKCEIQNLTDFNDFSSGLHLAYSGEKITETPSFDHSIGDIGNSDEDVEMRTESYKELEDSDIITLSNDVSEEIGKNLDFSSCSSRDYYTTDNLSGNYNIPELSHNGTGTFNGTGSITNGTGYFELELECFDGSYKNIGESLSTGSCDINYSWNGSICEDTDMSFDRIQNYYSNNINSSDMFRFNGSYSNSINWGHINFLFMKIEVNSLSDINLIDSWDGDGFVLKIENDGKIRSKNRYNSSNYSYYITNNQELEVGNTYLLFFVLEPFKLRKAHISNSEINSISENRYNAYTVGAGSSAYNNRDAPNNTSTDFNSSSSIKILDTLVILNTDEYFDLKKDSGIPYPNRDKIENHIRNILK